MQIGTAYFYNRSATGLRDLASRATQIQSEITAQRRISTPSIDPVAAARIALLGRRQADNTQYAANVTLASGLLGQADSALEGVQTQVQRATELALRASNDTLSDTDREAISAELKGIVDDLYATANQKDVRGAPLFGGATGDTAFTRDPVSGVISYAGVGETSPIPIGLDSQIIATDTGERLFTGIGPDKRDLFAIVSNLAAALQPGASRDPDTVRKAIDDGITGLNAAGERLSSARASIGARGARLDIEADRLATTKTETTIDQADLDGFDLQTSIAELQQTSVVLNAAQATFTKLSQLSLFDMLR